MPTTLAIDIGSSSVKAAILQGTTPVSPLVRAPFKTLYDNVRAEARATDILRAVSKAARETLRQNTATRPELVALSTMSPSWLAMDSRGQPLTPVVTHQDRRSLDEARRIEKEVGRGKHLAITGNRPVPGGISSTTAAWFARHERSLLKKADLVGHIQTYLLRALTGARAIDPSNASFTGLYHTVALDLPTDGSSLWDDELLSIVGLKKNQLPSVLPGDTVAGALTPHGARALSLPTGTPVLTGVVDTTASMLLGGAHPGMMFNSIGSTDVLAVVTTDPRPGPDHLTRHLGIGQKWVHVMTLSAAGTALAWAGKTLFSELSDPAFFSLVAKLARKPSVAPPASAVTFDPHLAGSRTSVEQPLGAFTNLRLSTTREDMLAAVIESLSQASAARITHLRKVTPHKISTEILRTGGAGKLLGPILYRYWPKLKTPYRFTDIPEATVLGLGQLASGLPV